MNKLKKIVLIIDRWHGVNINKHKNGVFQVIDYLLLKTQALGVLC